MGMRSTITKLPEDVRSAFEKRVSAGESVEALTAWLKAQGHERSHSCVGRYLRAKRPRSTFVARKWSKEQREILAVLGEIRLAELALLEKLRDGCLAAPGA